MVGWHHQLDGHGFGWTPGVGGTPLQYSWFKKLDISTKEGKQRLIDGFINAIYLYDDKITFTFNYKDGTKTVFLSELNCTPSGSDLKCLGAPQLT